MVNMLEKGKISALQMALLMNPTILATAILVAPAVTARLAERDMWLSPLWASLIGFAAVYLAYLLNKLFPSETIIEYSGHIVGRAAGKIVGFVFLAFYLHVNGIVVREYGEFVLGSFLTKTPITAVMICMVFISACAVYGGLEVMGRCAEIMVPVVVLLYIVIVILLIPVLDPENILPFMEKGVTPSLIGALVPQGWFSEFFIVAFMLPYVADRNKALKWGMLAVAFVTFILFINNVAALLLLGEITGSYSYPVLVMARYISYADFFEHVESVVMAIWVTGMFVKITMFHYVLVLGTAQWLKLSDYRPVVFPLGFLLLGFSLWAAPSSEDLARYLGTSIPLYLTTVQVGIPLFLVAVAMLRKKYRAKTNQGG